MFLQLRRVCVAVPASEITAAVRIYSYATYGLTTALRLFYQCIERLLHSCMSNEMLP